MIVVIGLLVVIWLASKDWQMPSMFRIEPKMTEKQKQRYKKDMKVFLRKYPDNLAKKYNPEIVAEMQALDEYKSLERDYENGRIDQIDFQIKALPLLEKIDVNDL